MCFLTLPSKRYLSSFVEGAAEFQAEGRLDSTYAAFLGYNLDKLSQRFDAFVEDLLGLADVTNQAKGWFPDRVFWLIEDNQYIGQASIRPELGTMYLVTYGGHIGYSIRPSRRRRGYGTKILALALAEARQLNMPRVLITCNSDNIASKKIIEANGGQYEGAMWLDPHIARAEGREPNDQVEKLRYWIDLAPPS